MAEITYLDFDMLIERSREGYRARVRRALGCPPAWALQDRMEVLLTFLSIPNEDALG